MSVQIKMVIGRFFYQNEPVNDTINDTINDTENAGTLSAYFNVSIITIKRDLSVLQKLGYIRHDGPNKGGRWLILKTEK